MELTGWDTVIFTTTHPKVVFARVAAALLSRWPAALIEGLEPARFGPLPITNLSADQFPSKSDHLIFSIFYRDPAMIQHMKEFAYTPMADGDGPFALLSRLRADVEFSVAGLDEVQVSKQLPHYPVAPYQA